MRAYERLPREGDAAFESYKCYRDLGPERSIRKVARKLGKSETLMARWSSKYGWVERARERDDYVEGIKQSALREHQREAALSTAARAAAVEQQVLANREKAGELTAEVLRRYERQLASLPLVRKTVVREGEDGKPGIYRIEPAVENPTLDAQRLHRIAVGVGGKDDLDALGGSGARVPGGGYGRPDEEVEEEFEEFVDELVRAREADS